MSYQRFMNGGATVVALLTLASCADDIGTPTAPELQVSRSAPYDVPIEPRTNPRALDLTDVLHVLPPLMHSDRDGVFDTGLLEWLEVQVCAMSGDDCVVWARYDAFTAGPAGLRLNGNAYQGQWSTGEAMPGVHWLSVHVAGLEVGAVPIHVLPGGMLKNGLTWSTLGTAGRALPLAFRVEANPAVRARVLAETGADAETIALRLLDEFGSTGEEVAVLLRWEDFDASAVAAALRDVHGMEAQPVAGALFGAGYEGPEVATALMEVWEFVAPVVVPILEFFGLTPEEVADAIVIAYDFTAEGLVWALAEAGWAADKVVQGVEHVYDVAANEWVPLLMNFGEFAVDEVVDGLRTGLGWAEEQMAAAWSEYVTLENAMAVAEAIGDAYGVAAETFAQIASGAGWAADVIAEGLKEAYGWTATQVAHVLDDLGIDQEDVEQALVLAGYAAGEVADAAESVWDTVSDWFCGIFGC